MSKTSIEWTERTWNPIRARNRETSKRGWFCTKVASECKNCYAERMNSGRFGNGIRYAVDQADKVELYLDQRVLEEPLHIRKPSTFFVCSMTDLYGEFVPDEWISEVYAVMALAGALHKGHTFQILTKRPERRLHFLTQTEEGKGIAAAKYAHIWEGVSAGTKKCADAYLDILRQTPAITRWWSAEPLLEDVLVRNLNTLLINWVVVGGESGPDARNNRFVLRLMSYDEALALMRSEGGLRN
jgi:protein gp37